MLKYLFLILLSIFPISQVYANDTVEAAATGNIVFEKAPELIMQDETLTIEKFSNKNLPDEKFSVDVDFHFKNISDHDVTRKIAFVLPPIKCRMDQNVNWSGLDLNDPNAAPNLGLKDFATTVDNNPQPYTIRSEAMLNNKNITTLLNQLQIPLNPCNIRTTNDNAPDPKYAANLKKYKLLTETNEAAWEENIYFEWTQTFPAGKVVNIHHHYTPLIGESVLALRTIKEFDDLFTTRVPPLKPLWNMNPETLTNSTPSIALINKDIYSDNQQRFCVVPKWVEYHLTTGANWNGGIGVFKLIIKDSGNTPFAINEFYKNTDKVDKIISGDTMSFTINHFIPEQDLLVLFLSLPKTDEDLQMCGVKTP